MNYPSLTLRLVGDPASCRASEVFYGAKGHNVAQARAVISYIATRDFSFSWSEVARRLQVDRSAVSRAIGRVENDPDLLETARAIRGALGLPEPEISQH
jgi:predicted regulator of amino acid metabolism with ACT domain